MMRPIESNWFALYSTAWSLDAALDERRTLTLFHGALDGQLVAHFEVVEVLRHLARSAQAFVDVFPGRRRTYSYFFTINSIDPS
jgi:hypothetical protein